jgi:hypothetical protein
MLHLFSVRDEVDAAIGPCRNRDTRGAGGGRAAGTRGMINQTCF